MSDSDVTPSSFDVYLWGTAFRSVVEALRAAMGQRIAIREGADGAMVTLSLTLPEADVKRVFGALERHRQEGGLELGSEPDRAMATRDIFEQLASARRTRHISFELSKSPSADEPNPSDSIGSLYRQHVRDQIKYRNDPDRTEPLTLDNLGRTADGASDLIGSIFRWLSRKKPSDP